MIDYATMTDKALRSHLSHHTHNVELGPDECESDIEFHREQLALIQQEMDYREEKKFRDEENDWGDGGYAAEHYGHGEEYDDYDRFG